MHPKINLWGVRKDMITSKKLEREQIHLFKDKDSELKIIHL
jgi:hypothetical protein